MNRCRHTHKKRLSQSPWFVAHLNDLANRGIVFDGGKGTNMEKKKKSIYSTFPKLLDRRSEISIRSLLVPPAVPHSFFWQPNARLESKVWQLLHAYTKTPLLNWPFSRRTQSPFDDLFEWRESCPGSFHSLLSVFFFFLSFFWILINNKKVPASLKVFEGSHLHISENEFFHLGVAISDLGLFNFHYLFSTLIFLFFIFLLVKKQNGWRSTQTAVREEGKKKT